MSLSTFFQPHYAAPITGALFALTTQAIRHLWVARHYGNPMGRYVRPLVCFTFLLTLTLSVVSDYVQPSRAFRKPVIATFEHEQGSHLVIVRYKKNHNFAGRDWVYNEPDIDASDIVWARDMGGAKNEELVGYFENRQVWLLEADSDPPKLVCYPRR